jgi:hypothetical protein
VTDKVGNQAKAEQTEFKPFMGKGVSLGGSGENRLLGTVPKNHSIIPRPALIREELKTKNAANPLPMSQVKPTVHPAPVARPIEGRKIPEEKKKMAPGMIAKNPQISQPASNNTKPMTGKTGPSIMRPAAKKEVGKTTAKKTTMPIARMNKK